MGRGHRSAGIFKIFYFYFPLTNFKNITKFLFLAFEFNFGNLNDLDIGDDMDKVLTNPLDSNYIDEEPEWHAEENFMETITDNLLSVILATPAGMAVGLSLWTVYILLTKAVISLWPGNNTTVPVVALLNYQEVNSRSATPVNNGSATPANNDMEMRDMRDNGRVFGEGNPPQDLPTTESTSTPVSRETPPPALETLPPALEAPPPALENILEQFRTNRRLELGLVPTSEFPDPPPSHFAVQGVVDVHQKQSPSKKSTIGGSFKSSRSASNASFKSSKSKESSDHDQDRIDQGLN